MTPPLFILGERGALALCVDVKTTRPWRDLPAGEPVAKVYLNNYKERKPNPLRVELAEDLCRFLNETHD